MTGRLSILIALIFLAKGLQAYTPDRLLYLKNFQTLGERACKENKVIVVMISRESCPYCIKLKKVILIPEVNNGELKDQWILRELKIDKGNTHIDFNGQKVKSVDYARSIKAAFTPTVLFLDKYGNEIGKRIVGTGGTIDFYDFYLKRSINQALENSNCQTIKET